jgi:hypothetical protein
MKRIMAFIFLGISLKTYSQQITPIAYSVENRMYAGQASSTPLNLNLEQQHAQYVRIHKATKISGWTSIGVGVPLTFIGLLAIAESVESGKNTERSGIWLLSSGGTLIVASIPLLIVSHHYKNKAASMAIGVGAQEAFTLQQNGVGAIAQPAVTLSFGL